MMSKDVDNEQLGLYRDPLMHIVYCFRENDPTEYGFICPECFKRYGKAEKYIEVKRCDTCPPYYPGMETGWCITRKKRDELKQLGYFSKKPKGGKRKFTYRKEA